MGIDYQVDAEGDVEMVAPQSIFEVTRAPSLSAWSQSAIVSFLRERKQYEVKVKEHSLNREARSRRCDRRHADAQDEQEDCRMVNDRVPDVTQLFASELKMDLSEEDIEERLANYFIATDRLVEDSGLSGTLGRGKVTGDDEWQRMKLCCKLLLANVTSEILKVKETTAKTGKVPQRLAKQPTTRREATANNQNTGQQRQPPRDGCLICKGAHWARECPTATAEQKAERITAGGEPAFRNAVINGVLDVPFCPDTGPDANIIGRLVFDELRDLIPSLPIDRVGPPVQVIAAGGNTMLCREKIHIDLQIVSAAGPLALTNIECLVVDAPEEELLLGRATLQSVGVDLDGVFEQLAQQHADEADVEADDIPADHVEVVGETAGDVLRRLVDEAMEVGFDGASADQLRDFVMRYADVFWLRLGHDEPAEVEPLEVRLVPGAQPYRSGVRRYPEAQRQFLRGYVSELGAAGLVERNNRSRWSCPALPVAKQGTNEFRISIDYRPVNKLTVPLAGAAPNLTVVMEAVRGVYGFGTIDFHKGFWRMPLHPNSLKCSVLLSRTGCLPPRACRKVTVAPLQENLERVMHDRGRRKSQLRGTTLVRAEDEQEAFRATLEMLERSCKLIFPDKGATVCMFTDASLTGWALVVTQVCNWQDGVPVEQQIDLWRWSIQEGPA
ncbi:hypothetical protein ON010_g8708 [Phytophthora cinnamomi]|nr:hypothetical protein ON010_g8708 [Phytophthora cinnamomi]